VPNGPLDGCDSNLDAIIRHPVYRLGRRYLEVDVFLIQQQACHDWCARASYYSLHLHATSSLIDQQLKGYLRLIVVVKRHSTAHLSAESVLIARHTVRHLLRAAPYAYHLLSFNVTCNRLCRRTTEEIADAASHIFDSCTTERKQLVCAAAISRRDGVLRASRTRRTTFNCPYCWIDSIVEIDDIVYNCIWWKL